MVSIPCFPKAPVVRLLCDGTTWRHRCPRRAQGGRAVGPAEGSPRGLGLPGVTNTPLCPPLPALTLLALLHSLEPREAAQVREVVGDLGARRSLPSTRGTTWACGSLLFVPQSLYLQNGPPPSLADEDQERRGESDVHLSHGWTRMCCPAQAGPCGGLAGISPPSSSCRKQADAAGASLVPALLTAAPVTSRKISVLLLRLSLALHCCFWAQKRQKEEK